MNRCNIYRNILVFSLEQWLHYLDFALEDYEKNAKIKETKNIVYRSNLAVMEQSKDFIQKVTEEIKNVDTSIYKTPEIYCDNITDIINKMTKKSCAPTGCTVILTEKAKKALDYFNSFFKDFFDE